MTDVMDMVDAPPASKGGEEEERIPPPEQNSPWKVYLKPYWLTKLLNNTKKVYGPVVGFWYLAQFIGCCATINLYGDKDRLNPCATTGSLADPEEASKVYDLPLLLMAIFHMIEWIRTTVLLTIVLIGVNWTISWYITIPNTLYGLVTYAFVHMAYFDEDGQDCKEAQPDRASWILTEIIFFWVAFFLFAFPFIWTLCMGK
jgi:hypothetical protein